MGTYVPNTEKEQQEMLKACGYQDFDDLYGGIPAELKRKEPLAIPAGKTEMEVRQAMERMARKNHVDSSVFRGAGAYHH